MRKITLSLALVITFCAAAFFLYRAEGLCRRFAQGQAILKKRSSAWKELKAAVENRARVFHGTAGVVIKDLDSGREIVFNQHARMPAASLVKIPIMLSCFYAAQERKITLNDTIKLNSAEKVSGSRVLGDSPAGSLFTVEKLLYPMIAESDNAAANLLINFLGFENLNSYFKKIGLKDTNLARKMMDFKARREGEENYTTAKDMAYLLEALYRNKFLNPEVSQKCLGILGQQKINDRIPRKLPRDGTFIAHKTGLERHICHDVGIVYTDKGNFLICVLVKHQDRFAKASKRLISDIALLTYNYYR
jgi:beta-lactamase class A